MLQLCFKSSRKYDHGMTIALVAVRIPPESGKDGIGMTIPLPMTFHYGSAEASSATVVDHTV
jgi:hypothetical protein